MLEGNFGILEKLFRKNRLPHMLSKTFLAKMQGMDRIRTAIHPLAFLNTADNYFVTTEPLASRKYYDGSGAIGVLIPENQ